MSESFRDVGAEGFRLPQFRAVGLSGFCERRIQELWLG